MLFGASSARAARSAASATLALILIGISLAFGATAPAPPPAKPAKSGIANVTPSGKPIRAWINGVPDTGQFLPDTAVLARVDDHAITAREFVASYFNSYAEDRPAQDDAGRRSFLQSMIDKEVLDRTARAAGYAATFEDRVALREHTERVLSNILYQRAIVDSAAYTEADIQRVYDQYKYEQHFRHILFSDLATARRVRLDLVGGRITWKAAAAKYSIAHGDKGPDGDIGWVTRGGLSYPTAEEVYALKPAEISQPFEVNGGVEMVQSVERKTVTPRLLSSLRGTIIRQIQEQRAALLSQKLYDLIAAQIGYAPDTTNIAWACKFFPTNTGFHGGPQGLDIVIDESVPEVPSTDTSRVLARWKTGRISVGGFLHAFGDIPPIMRPNVSTPEGLTQQVANTVLEPYRAQAARERGYDKDPRVVAQIEMKRNQILVEHLYEDSVASRVSVVPAERREYYEKNKASFITYAKRDFATILRYSQAGADSVVRELKSGRTAEQIIRADSLRGFKSGTLHQMQEDEHGPFRKMVFEELKPGDATTIGPGKDGGYAVVQLISVTPGRQLSFQEADAIVDENLRNQKSEAELQKLLARLRRRHRIEQEPGRTALVRLVDPTL